MLENYVCYIMMFFGFLIFCSMRSHLLLTLLSLEFLGLILYFMLFIFMFFYGVCLYFILIFLTFIVCEGAMGLALLVSLIRCHGSDNVSSLSILGW